MTHAIELVYHLASQDGFVVLGLCSAQPDQKDCSIEDDF